METANPKTETAQVTDNPASVKVETFTLKFKTFLHGLNAVKDSASKDSMRHILHGINFVLSKGKLTLQATDGKRLSLIELPLVDQSSAKQINSFIVDSETIESLIKLFKKIKNLDTVTFAVDFTDQSSKPLKVDLLGLTSFKTVDGNYPNIDNLLNGIEKDVKAKYKTSLAFTQILKALKELDDLKEKTAAEVLEKIKASPAYIEYLSREGDLAGSEICTALHKVTLKELKEPRKWECLRFTPDGQYYRPEVLNTALKSLPAYLGSIGKPCHLEIERIGESLKDETDLAFNFKFLRDFVKQVQVTTDLHLEIESFAAVSPKCPLYYKGQSREGLIFKSVIMPQRISDTY